MSSYSANQIVGKQLVAKKSVKLKRYASNESPTIFTAVPGTIVGVVYSWVDGTEGKPLWWMFYDKNGRLYYALHEPGAYDVQSLKEQGTMDVKEEQKALEEKAKENSGWEFPNPFKSLDLSKPLTTGIIIVAAAIGISYLKKP